MSVSYELTNCTTEELVDFVLEEHKKDTGLPVHPFNQLDKHMPERHITALVNSDDTGCFFVVGDNKITAWGKNNWVPIIAALQRCNVQFRDAW